MDHEGYKIRPARLCYEVQFGHGCASSVRFGTFEEAELFYRGYRARCSAAMNPLNDCRIVNTDSIDGADDASPAAQHGLTADEWERVQEVS